MQQFRLFILMIATLIVSGCYYFNSEGDVKCDGGHEGPYCLVLAAHEYYPEGSWTGNDEDLREGIVTINYFVKQKIDDDYYFSGDRSRLYPIALVFDDDVELELDTPQVRRRGVSSLAELGNEQLDLVKPLTKVPGESKIYHLAIEAMPINLYDSNGDGNLHLEVVFVDPDDGDKLYYSGLTLTAWDLVPGMERNYASKWWYETYCSDTLIDASMIELCGDYEEHVLNQ